ncbi:MAG: GMC oxidoreductase [Bacteroidia bacterium]
MPQTTQNTPSERTFDAIVIGSGISGGWAAKELAEKGLKTLVLERGRDVKHQKDYPTALKNPWDFPHRNRIPEAVQEANPVVSRCYAFREATEHFFVKDQEHPYIQEKPFDWIRAYQVGGKSLLWARQTQRWSRFDFEGPARDGYAVDWPIRYDDIAPWYSHVEKFVGISGNHDGLETLPDSEFLPAWTMNVVEKEMQGQIMEAFPNRDVIIGRCAHLTEPKEIHLQQGRGKCQARSLCERGCPYGAYFSSNASTIPWAEKTGNMTLRPDSVVESIIYDEEQERAIGVRVIDRLTKEKTEYYARIIFVNAACINSNLLLLNSKSDRFPNGLGNDNGLLGKYIAFHNYRGSLTAKRKGHEDTYYYGRRPTAIMMPNFRNVYEQDTDFLRGYMSFYTATRKTWGRKPDGPGIGAEYKKQMSQPGDWSIYMMMQGETIPKEENHVRLSPDQVDEWGVPLIVASVDYDQNDEKLLQDFLEQGEAMLKAAGCYDIVRDDNGWAPGLDIHVMGGARMGKDPETSLLNGWSQFHNCKNVFVTDGAAMTSTGVQNPSLTFMALTARAADYAAEQFKAGKL